MSNAGFIPYDTMHFVWLMLDLSYIWCYTLRLFNAEFILYVVIYTSSV